MTEGVEHAGIAVHHGFYEGARQHADAIVAVIQQRNREAGRALPVWVSGHSLGGAYANCIMLHLLANKRTTHLFAAGKNPPLSSAAEFASPCATVRAVCMEFASTVQALSDHDWREL